MGNSQSTISQQLVDSRLHAGQDVAGVSVYRLSVGKISVKYWWNIGQVLVEYQWNTLQGIVACERCYAVVQ